MLRKVAEAEVKGVQRQRCAARRGKGLRVQLLGVQAAEADGSCLAAHGAALCKLNGGALGADGASRGAVEAQARGVALVVGSTVVKARVQQLCEGAAEAAGPIRAAGEAALHTLDDGVLGAGGAFRCSAHSFARPSEEKAKLQRLRQQHALQHEAREAALRKLNDLRAECIAAKAEVATAEAEVKALLLQRRAARKGKGPR